MPLSPLKMLCKKKFLALRTKVLYNSHKSYLTYLVNMLLEGARSMEQVIIKALPRWRWLENGKCLLRLAISMFRIGLIGFGGGSALIPVIEAETVGRGLLSRRSYEEDVLAASITPGALPVGIAAGVGQRVGGMTGMLLAAFMMALPGALLLVACLAFLTHGQGQVLRFVQGLSIGIGAFIMSLLALYVVRSVQSMGKAQPHGQFLASLIVFSTFLFVGGHNLGQLFGFTTVHGLSTLAMLGLAFFLLLFLPANPSRTQMAIAFGMTVLFIGTEIHGGSGAKIVPMCMTLLVARSLYVDFSASKKQIAHQNFLRAMLHEFLGWLGIALLAILPFIFSYEGASKVIAAGALSSLLSFGGGDAYLTIADGIFIAGGIVPREVFYGLLVPLVNVLPGSILCKTLAGIGFLCGVSMGGFTGGLLGALAGFTVSVTASGVMFGFVARIFRTFHDAPIFLRLSHWLRPVIAGLLVNVALSLLIASLKAGVSLGIATPLVLLTMLGVFSFSFFLLHVRQKSSVFAMGIGLAGSLFLCLESL